MKNILLVIIVFCSAMGQTFGQRNPEAKLPLKFEIYSKQNGECSEELLKIYGRITNTTERSILIDKKLMWIRVHIVKSSIDGLTYTMDSLNIIEDLGPEYEPDLVVLRPKEVAESSRTFSLSDEFFARPGEYTFKARYVQLRKLENLGEKAWKGTVDSNTLVVSLNDCKK